MLTFLGEIVTLSVVLDHPVIMCNQLRSKYIKRALVNLNFQRYVGSFTLHFICQFEIPN